MCYRHKASEMSEIYIPISQINLMVIGTYNPLSDRCLLTFRRNALPPFLPKYEKRSGSDIVRSQPRANQLTCKHLPGYMMSHAIKKCARHRRDNLIYGGSKEISNFS